MSLRDWVKANLPYKIGYYNKNILNVKCPCCGEDDELTITDSGFCCEQTYETSCDVSGSTLKELKEFINRGKMIITYEGEK